MAEKRRHRDQPERRGAPDFVAALAAPRPTPGGGAAAAHAGLLGASLVRMVLGLTLKGLSRRARGRDAAQPGQRGDEELRSRLEASARRADDLAERFESLQEDDAAAFSAYLDARRLPRETEEEAVRRRAALTDAAARATEVPLRTLEACWELLDLVGCILSFPREARLRAESDLGGAVELAHAAFRIAELNIRANLGTVDGPDLRANLRSRYEVFLERFEPAYRRLYEKFRQA